MCVCVCVCVPLTNSTAINERAVEAEDKTKPTRHKYMPTSNPTFSHDCPRHASYISGLEEDSDFLSSKHWVRVPKTMARIRRMKSEDRKLINISDR